MLPPPTGTHGNDNLREEYARHRIKNSPLSILPRKPSVLDSPNPPPPPFSSHSFKLLSPSDYKFIQASVAYLILQVLSGKEAPPLEALCDIILTEVKNIEALGLDYVISNTKQVELEVELELELEDKQEECQ